MPSAAIASFHYSPDRQKLFVRFQNGGEYVYSDVPDAVHRAFREAQSKGRFFQTKIRDRYPYDRLDS